MFICRGCVYDYTHHHQVISKRFKHISFIPNLNHKSPSTIHHVNHHHNSQYDSFLPVNHMLQNARLDSLSLTSKGRYFNGKYNVHINAHKVIHIQTIAWCMKHFTSFMIPGPFFVIMALKIINGWIPYWFYQLFYFLCIPNFPPFSIFIYS